MNHKKTKILSLIILIVLGFVFYFSTGTVLPAADPGKLIDKVSHIQPVEKIQTVPGNKEEVFAHIKASGKLPDYYITKSEARELGWNGGSLEAFAPGKLIGGDYFGNFEKLLPDKIGRKWTEADIDTFEKSSRGAKRIVFSSDGLIYYSNNHYSSFTKLGEAD
ncbi:MAG: ribonuclease [Clostridiales bacterium]|nr:ribonuclease [Clostridiales bacterium]